MYSGKNGPYTIIWDNHAHKFKDDVQYAYYCSCQSYKFYPGPCKHLIQITNEHRRCGWDQFADGEEPVIVNVRKTCPKCGGPVTPVRHAV